LEQELRKIAAIPDPELVIKFVPMTEGFFLRQASFILDGNELDSWYLEQLQTASEPQIVFQEKVGSGHRELVVRLVYSSESSLLSYMNDYQYALTQRIHIEARNGLRSHIYIQAKMNRFESWSKRLKIEVRRDYEMTAKLADGEIPPPPQRAIQSAKNVLASLGEPKLAHDLKSEIERRPEFKLEELLNPESESNQLVSSKAGLEIMPARLKLNTRRNGENNRNRQSRPVVQKESPGQMMALSATEPEPKPRESSSHALNHAPARPTAKATTRQMVLPETTLSNASLPASEQSVKRTPPSRSRAWLLVLGAAVASFLVFGFRLIARKAGKSTSGNQELL
jgi:hypothetical protein